MRHKIAMVICRWKIQSICELSIIGTGMVNFPFLEINILKKLIKKVIIVKIVIKLT